MRYSGKLGIAEQVEVSPGVWEETITEHDVLGELLQKTEVLSTDDAINPAYSTTTSISVFGRGVGQLDNSMIRYATMTGKAWILSSIVSEPPRLILYIGEEYHGPTP